MFDLVSDLIELYQIRLTSLSSFPISLKSQIGLRRENMKP